MGGRGGRDPQAEGVARAEKMLSPDCSRGKFRMCHTHAEGELSVFRKEEMACYFHIISGKRCVGDK